ncbi:MAG: transcription elongation factor GreB [Burkholderiales bacterium]
MSKAFVRDSERDEEDVGEAKPVAPPGRNYVSLAGYGRLKAELKDLVEVERPKVVQVVAWAAANGDRSENADYVYGKKRLREIDRRVRFLVRRLESAEVVDSVGRATDQIFFGATVTVTSKSGGERSVTIVGIDEADAARGRVSWISPIARALFKAWPGDAVTLRSPGGTETLEILAVRYDPID